MCQPPRRAERNYRRATVRPEGWVARSPERSGAGPDAAVPALYAPRPRATRYGFNSIPLAWSWIGCFGGLLLTACVPIDSVRPDPPQPTSTTAAMAAPEPLAATASAPPPSTAAPVAAVAAAETIPILAPDGDLWQHLRSHAGFVSCDRLSPPAGRWLQRFAERRHALEPAFDRALPQIALVAAELAAHDVPAEFALLPMVESRYLPARPRGGGSAGIWQLMPATARGLGVLVAPGYDGRLDTLVASRAAAKLLADLGQRFDGDWRLVDMAFNAGEFRVRRALRAQAQAGRPRHAATLAVAATTHAHLAQLEALYCLVAEPERWRFALPESASERWLAALPLKEPIAIDFLAEQIGVPVAELRAQNPALDGLLRTPDLADYALLVSARQWSQASATVAALPALPWRHWARVRTPRDHDWAALAAGHALAVDVLLSVNHRPAGEAAPLSDWIWVPIAAGSESPAVVVAGAATHTVHAGDTLWSIARRYRLRLADLLRWNASDHGSVLQPGQVLRLAEP